MDNPRWKNPEKMALAHQAIGELRAMKRRRPYVPTADIDIAWVLSAPGTVKEVSDDGIYAGENMNLKLITAGIDVVRDVTAARLRKSPAKITKHDIAFAGPRLFYNGEYVGTEKGQDLQNEHLREMAEDPDFPLPKSKLIIEDLGSFGTLSQVEEIADYFKETRFAGKVAVVSMIHHSIRVGRYLQLHRARFEPYVKFVNAALPETVNSIGKSLREVRKVATYGSKNPPDLAFENYFFTRAPKPEAVAA